MLGSDYTWVKGEKGIVAVSATVVAAEGLRFKGSGLGDQG